MNHIMYSIRQPYPPPNAAGNAPPTAEQTVPIVAAAQSQQTTSYMEKILVGLDHAAPAFNLREQIIGAGGANLQYIRNETGAIVTLRGRGSMFIDPILGVESHEPLHLHLEHTRYDGLNAAKQLVKNLVETLQQELIQFQQSQPIITAAPPPIVTLPPPPIIQQQQSLEVQKTQQQQHTLVQQSYHNQQVISAPTQNIIQHQFVQQNGIPIQLQQGNVIIQQQPPTANLNIPPPVAPLKQGQIVQFQQPPPPILQQQHAQQQVQAAQAGAGTPIILNPQQYTQYQYIQQPIQNTRADGTIQGNQLTIHHVYQPQQQIQVQASAGQPTQTIEQQFAQQVRAGQQFQTAPQQYITIQGSTAYMMPPPTITHQATQQLHPQLVTAAPNIIIQQQPHQQLHQLAMQIPQTSLAIQNFSQATQQQTNASVVEAKTSTEDGTGVKDEVKTETEEGEENKSSDVKQEISTETEENEKSDEQPTTVSAVPMTHIPPPTMTVPPPPPPMSCVQHFVGNTLITTTAAPQMHIAATNGQQIIHTAPNGQNYIVNQTAQQWQNRPPPPQPQQQQQTTTQYQLTPSEFHAISQSISAASLSAPPPPIYSQTQTLSHHHQTQVAMTINPTQQVQLQFQPQMIQQIQANAQQQQPPLPPPPQQQAQFNVIQQPQQQQPTVALTGPPPGIAQRSMQPQFTIASMQQAQQFIDQQNRSGQKRKSDGGITGPAVHQPRLGMGSKDPTQQAEPPRFPNMEFISQPPPPPNNNNGTAPNGNNLIGQDDLSNGLKKNIQYQAENRNSMDGGNIRPPYPNNGMPSRPPRFNYNGQGFFNRPPIPPHHPMSDGGVGGGYMHRMGFNGQPPPPPPPSFRPEGPGGGGNINGNYGPRFRGQWQ